jgi:hypothetical protein
VKFVPQSQTKVDSVRHINYTCSPERYRQLEAIANKAGVSLKELLRQMVEFSLEAMK